MISEIVLKPTVVISNEQYKDKTICISKKAENVCLITHSIRSQVMI